MAWYRIAENVLDAIANAINAKTGGTSPMTPVEMVLEIQSIPTGGGVDPVGLILDNNLTEYTNLSYNGTSNKAIFAGQPLTKFCMPGLAINGNGMFVNCRSLLYAVLSKIASNTVNQVFHSAYPMNLESLDFTDVTYLNNGIANNCANLNKIILRGTDISTLLSATAFDATPFKSGGSGGTIYIPETLYNHLGDGTALDYKAATNWATIDAYGTITWAKIEGSIYETQYADGTTIPTT